MRCAAIVVLAWSSTVAADDDKFPDVVSVTVKATSTLSAKRKVYEPWYPLAPDRQSERLWCEGKPDEGIGEALIVTFGSPTKLDAIALSVGVWKTEALFKANNIVTAVDVTTDDGRKLAFVFPEERKQVEVKLGGAPITELRIAIAKVKKGKMNDSCIAEVKLALPSKALVLVGVDRAQGAALAPAVSELRRVLADCDDAGLRAHVRFPFVYKPPNAEGEKPKRKSYPDAKHLAKACKNGELSGRDGEFESMQVVTEAPGTIEIGPYPNAWRLVLDGGAWKLAAIDDNSV